MSGPGRPSDEAARMLARLRRLVAEQRVDRRAARQAEINRVQRRLAFVMKRELAPRGG